MASDKELQKIERALQKVYKDAEKEAQAKLNAYNDKIRAQIKQIEDLEAVGRITQDEAYDMKSAIYMKPSRLKPLLANISADYTNANQTAMRIANGALPTVYAENYNEALLDIKDQATGQGFDIKGTWDLYDRDTVNRLATQKPDLLPTRSVNIPKDLRWNQNHIRSALVQGIIQGDSIDHLADRLQRVTDMNRSAAVRNARTMVTGAENAGRQESYDRMTKRGVKMRKVWMATHDSRVRDAHEVMDGQEVDEDEKFTDGEGNKIEYPGDPNAPACTVYNCRCTMHVKVVGFDFGKTEQKEATQQAEQQVEHQAEKPKQTKPSRKTTGEQLEYVGDTEDRNGWIQRTGKYKSSEQASEIRDAIDLYTGNFYKDIHNETAYGWEYKMPGLDESSHAGTTAGFYRDILNGYIENKNVPTYKGTIYRGLYISDGGGATGVEKIEAIIKSGTWVEPGITSFSSDIARAEGFAKTDQPLISGARVVLHCEDNTSGVPIAHLSGFTREQEVLVGSQRAHKGWNITNYTIEAGEEGTAPVYHIYMSEA